MPLLTPHSHENAIYSSMLSSRRWWYRNVPRKSTSCGPITRRVADDGLYTSQRHKPLGQSVNVSPAFQGAKDLASPAAFLSPFLFPHLHPLSSSLNSTTEPASHHHQHVNYTQFHMIFPSCSRLFHLFISDRCFYMTDTPLFLGWWNLQRRSAFLMPQLKDYGRTIVAQSLSLLILSGIFLGLRLYCKVIRRRGFWWDDHVLIASWVSFYIQSPCSLSTLTTFGDFKLTQIGLLCYSPSSDDLRSSTWLW